VKSSSAPEYPGASRRPRRERWDISDAGDFQGLGGWRGFRTEGEGGERRTSKGCTSERIQRSNNSMTPNHRRGAAFAPKPTRRFAYNSTTRQEEKGKYYVRLEGGGNVGRGGEKKEIVSIVAADGWKASPRDRSLSPKGGGGACTSTVTFRKSKKRGSKNR